MENKNQKVSEPEVDMVNETKLINQKSRFEESLNLHEDGSTLQDLKSAAGNKIGKAETFGVSTENNLHESEGQQT